MKIDCDMIIKENLRGNVYSPVDWLPEWVVANYIRIFFTSQEEEEKVTQNSLTETFFGSDRRELGLGIKIFSKSQGFR